MTDKPSIPLALKELLDRARKPRPREVDRAAQKFVYQRAPLSEYLEALRRAKRVQRS